jgi:kinesin family protein 2/24
MPEPEFLERCMKTSGVGHQQANAFYKKLWRMHVDSHKQNNRPGQQATHDVLRTSSAVPSEVSSIPFKERIRPGMVVTYNPHRDTGMKVNMAMVHCPDWAIETEVKDAHGKAITRGDIGRRRYLCSMVSPATLKMNDPAAMKDAYDVSIWTQFVIDVEDMEAEMILEYDEASRYYYLVI